MARDRVQFLEAMQARIIASMRAQGISQTYLAESTGHARQTIGKVLAPMTTDRAFKNGPKIWELIQIAEVLEVDPRWLIFGMDNDDLSQ